MDHRRARPSLSRRTGSLALGALVAAVMLWGSVSCKSNDCQSTRTYFEQNVWSAFMSTTCTKCHTLDGTAVADSNAKFVLQTSSYPGFIDADLANITLVANIQYQGTPEILLKPLGQMNHGGGVVLQQNSPEYQALTELVNRITGSQASCTEGPNTTLQGVTLADGPSTLRRAAIDLAGRLPTSTEVAAVTSGGDAALDEALDELMTEPNFYVRIREIFNDMLLTDEFLEYGGRAIDFMDSGFYPSIAPYQQGSNPAYSSAQRPLIVQNDKPFTDAVASTYTVVNPYSAIAYGLDKTITFKDPTNYNEFHEAQVVTTPMQGNPPVAGTPISIPHAGVLSTPSFLNRWPTTPTNRSRGRARRVYQFFLATDVLQLAVRPVDATSVSTLEDPTRNSDLCNVCHKVIDPVAGGFRGYEEDNNYEDFDPMAAWHDDMYPPGFGSTPMDQSFYSKALQFIGPSVAADPRFAIGSVHTVYQAMTGRTPIAYPDDSTDPAFATKLAAFEAQDAFFGDTAQAFTNGAYNLKVIFKAVIKSPYYRAVAAPPDMDPGLLIDVGSARLLTPEMLNRKIAAVLGYRWRHTYDWQNPHDYLVDDYNILYGGIDSDSTITRLTGPNGIIGAVAGRMANDASCHVTAWDFTKPRSSRTLFPLVDITEVPESSGHPVDASVADIKANIQYLHQYLLDENLDLADPEIERTFQLFLDTWHELALRGDGSLTYDCQGQWNPNDGTTLDTSIQIDADVNFTIRSWQAVITYMLSDYKFLYE